MPWCVSKIAVHVLSLQDWELSLLEITKWDLSAPTPHDFLSHFRMHLDVLISPNEYERLRQEAASYISRCYVSGIFVNTICLHSYVIWRHVLTYSARLCCFRLEVFLLFAQSACGGQSLRGDVATHRS